MTDFLTEFLLGFRNAFSRKASFSWFVVMFAGFVLRADRLGVSSVVRALEMSPSLYPHLLHFLHASSWDGSALLELCVKWVAGSGTMTLRNGRIVMLGDESKVPQEGRRMPSVMTLRQTSETSSKPSYFRGHEWGFLGILIGASGKSFCVPAWACLSEPKRKTSADKPDTKSGSRGCGTARTAGIVRAAAGIATMLSYPAFLVLDAFYCVGPVFTAAAGAGNVTIVTRAKANCRAWIPASPSVGKRGRGRPRMYESSVKVGTLYTTETERFEPRSAKVYGRVEQVRILARKLFWKPAGTLLLFVLVETSRGRITLACSDIDTDPVDVLELYCHRSMIEVMFDNIKNLLGLMDYRFWSKYLEPQRRRPEKNGAIRKTVSPSATAKTLKATRNFLSIGLVLLAFLQVFACRFGAMVSQEAGCWLRTQSGTVPSEFVAKAALTRILKRIFSGSASNPITKIIRDRLKSEESRGKFTEAA
jgi:hypothetical protein